MSLESCESVSVAIGFVSERTIKDIIIRKTVCAVLVQCSRVRWKYVRCVCCVRKRREGGACLGSVPEYSALRERGGGGGG